MTDNQCMICKRSDPADLSPAERITQAVIELQEPGMALAGEIWATIVVNRDRVPADAGPEFVKDMFDVFEGIVRGSYPDLIKKLDAKAARSEAQATQRSEAEPPHLQRLIEAAEELIEQIDDAEACRTGANQHLVIAAEKRLRQALQPYRSGK